MCLVMEENEEENLTYGKFVLGPDRTMQSEAESLDLKCLPNSEVENQHHAKNIRAKGQ